MGFKSDLVDEMNSRGECLDDAHVFIGIDWRGNRFLIDPEYIDGETYDRWNRHFVVTHDYLYYTYFTFGGPEEGMNNDVGSTHAWNADVPDVRQTCRSRNI